MTPRVRLFADRDYAAFVRIRRLAEQRDISVALAREQDGRWDHSRYERVRVVAADDERERDQRHVICAAHDSAHHNRK